MTTTNIALSTVLFILVLSSCGTTNDPPYNEARCQELSRKAEELRGKPQRRAMVLQQYQAECVN